MTPCNAALVADGVVRAALAEELLSRRKDDPALPLNALAWACRESRVAAADLDFVVFAEKPVQRFARLLGGPPGADPAWPRLP